MAASVSMEVKQSHTLLVKLSFVILLSIASVKFAAAIPNEELEAMLSVLRSNGYSRIGNAIETSDLRFDVLSAEMLTLFAPTDSSIFTLDMTLPAESYVSVLRFHAVPRRLSVSDLRVLPATSILPTLLPDRSLNVTTRTGDAVTVAVNGVRLEAPGMYYGNHVAVHGLAGALGLGFRVDQAGGPAMAPKFSVPVNAAENRFISWPPVLPPVHTTTLVPAPTPASIGLNSGLPYYPEIDQALHGDVLPRVASPPPETNGAVPRRMMSAITGSRSWVPVPAPAQGTVHGHGTLKTVTNRKDEHPNQMIRPFKGQEELGLWDKETTTVENDLLGRTLLERYIADRYSVWSNTLCDDECLDY